MQCAPLAWTMTVSFLHFQTYRFSYFLGCRITI